MRVTRSRFAASIAAAAAAAFVRYPASAAQYTFKFANDDAPNHPISVRALEAIEKIKAASNGQLDFGFFPNSQLGSTTQMLSQLRLGAIEFVQLPYGIMANVVPVCNIDFVPFAFPTYQDAWKARDGAFGEYLRSAVRKETGLHVFGTSWDNGFREIFNGLRPVNTPDDLKGMKLRVPAITILVALFKAFGASPSSVNINEEYTALQTHLVDGGEQDLIVIRAQKFYEVTKYIALTNHVSSGYGLFAHPAAWGQLPKKLQDLTEQTFNAAAVAQRNDMLHGDAPSEAALRAAGMIVNKPDVESFKAAVRRAGLYAEWRQTFGPEVWTLLERYAGKLAPPA